MKFAGFEHTAESAVELVQYFKASFGSVAVNTLFVFVTELYAVFVSDIKHLAHSVYYFVFVFVVLSVGNEEREHTNAGCEESICRFTGVLELIKVRFKRDP